MQIGQSPDVYKVECPYQIAVSTPTKQFSKVHFDLNICKECPLKERCQLFKNKGRYFFKYEDHLLGKRNDNIMKIPRERPKIRPNVEALMKKFKSRTSNGKTKVRGIFKISLFAFNAGIAINFGRIFRYIIEHALINELFSSIKRISLKNMLKTILYMFLIRKPDRPLRNIGYIWDRTKYLSNLKTVTTSNYTSF